MLHVGRCGSTVVAGLLEQTPRLTWDGEIFEPRIRARLQDPGDEPESFIRARVDLARHSYGFETKYLQSHHLGTLKMGLEDYVGLLDRIGFTHYVTLHRRNYLRRVVSGVDGRETRTWHATSDTPIQRTTVRLDPGSVPFGSRKSLLAVFTEMQEGEKSLKSVLRSRKAVHLTYEEHVKSDPRLAYRMVCELAGLSPSRQEIQLRPTNPQPISELIENYEDIEQLLRGSEYEWMLTA